MKETPTPRRSSKTAAAEGGRAAAPKAAAAKSAGKSAGKNEGKSVGKNDGQSAGKAVAKEPAAKSRTAKPPREKAAASNGAAPAREPRSVKDTKETVTLRLYVAGQTPKSLAALANLKRVCDEHLAAKFKIELQVIDLLERPHLAQADQILAIPTLVRQLPSPIKRIIGDLSNTERVLVGLDIQTGK